jgi:hypothetical protein
MGDSYRIRTELGINKSINVQLDQEFEFLEILSLKIQQTDIYTRSCADYGVLVGRVTANNGFGLPNARVSIFIPIEQVDESNPIITSIYPYKSPSDKNNDGYRYNLLPYTPSYSKHAATGTLPTKSDVLTGSTAVEIYDKYYRFTTKTNDSGDYMIMGVPLGEQTIVMDVDLSDIGEFSLTPQDLIRIGLATEAQVAGNQFRTSNDLNSLPQIINLTKNAEISPLWGDPEICDISINRLDFDLRDDANVDIQPTAVFMGSMFSSPDNMRIRRNCRPRDNMGNLCDLTSGPGQILSVRQTIQQDEDGNPVLEVYELDQAGNVIDGDGTWLTELPMNLDYIITNEFGERTLSNNQSIGIPTKSKYRFKIKWSQSRDLQTQTRRPSYLVPNVKEYGWTNPDTDPTNSSSQTAKNIQESSYYFGLAWSGYTNGFTGTEQIDRLNEIIDCEDTFYEFQFNKVYTVSSLIDQYKKGARGRFIGIKEIDDSECESTTNKFPVNDGFKNFDLLYFLFSIIFTVLQFVGIVLLINAHFILFIYTTVIQALCFLCSIKIPIINVRPFGFICNALRVKCETKSFVIRLPMITYPDCQSCSCNEAKINNDALLGGTSGNLTYVSEPSNYIGGLESLFGSDGTPSEDVQAKAQIFSQAIAGNDDSVTDLNVFKTPVSEIIQFLSEDSDERKHFAYAESLTLGERINVFNTRKSYFDGLNRIKVTFAKQSNIGKFHFDNTITVLANSEYQAGQLLTTVNPATTSDRNFLYTAQTENNIVNGITGTTIMGSSLIDVNYATTQTSNQTTTYFLPTGSTVVRQVYPQDREYFQVVTAITIADASKIWNTNELETFPNVLNARSRITLAKRRRALEPGYDRDDDFLINPLSVFDDIDSQYILILQRGVDPYSPKYVNEYNVVMRNDRLPSSDALNGSAWTTNPALLQQNNNFVFYEIPELDQPDALVGYATGAEIVTADLEGLPNEVTVLSSFDCENMVGLDCYTGFGDNFEVNQECTTKDAVEKGCYIFMRRPGLDLAKDLGNFGEWAFRFRFFYGLCRGVLSQSFMNNWVNGSLYFFPIQVDTFYNKQNRVGQVRFCEDVVYYNRDSNNFYYRSSPYNSTINKFIGKRSDKTEGGINDLNLLFPTTVINLGMKDYFYSEITFDTSTRGFILPNIGPTSYADTSDLVNLFVISRITDENFLQQLIPLGDNSINQLFSRDERRIDGDLAQLMSINCEIGNINFSPEYYDSVTGQTNQPTQILGTAKDPTIGVWFSSTTEDLQTKDYLTPGRINFRGNDDIGYYPYPYGIKSQQVPFYQWKLANTKLIFGTQLNSWATSSSDIVQNTRYQSLDRFSTNTPYFLGSNAISNDLNARGYIFNVNGTVGDGQYLSTGAIKQKFVVGAPFQFYFGTIVGQTALDKFKTKYSVDE